MNGAVDMGRPRVRWGRLLLWVIVGAGLLFLTFALAGALSGQPRPGDPAPDFTLHTYGGGTISLTELRGRVVVVNFWASWCPSCGEEAEALEQVWQTYRDWGVVVLGVDYADSEAEGLAFLAEYGVTYPNGPDLRSEISDAYRIRGAPETFVINGEGVITFFAARPLTFQEASAAVEAALAGEGG